MLNFAPRIPCPAYERKIVVCIPSFNNEEYCLDNLHTVFTQKYKNFSVLYVNDASTDSTLSKVSDFVAKHRLEKKITIISNTTNRGAMANWYSMIHSLDDRDIVVCLDGDDTFAHDKVLQRVNEAYADDRVWVTYGSYITWPYEELGHCRELSFSDLNNRKYREMPFFWSHLRTFYAGIFKKMPIKQFQDKHGKFYSMACDVAIMLGLMDSAGEHVYYIPSILYRYNRMNVLNDDTLNRSKQRQLEKYMKKRSPLKRVAFSKVNISS